MAVWQTATPATSYAQSSPARGPRIACHIVRSCKIYMCMYKIYVYMYIMYVYYVYLDNTIVYLLSLLSLSLLLLYYLISH